MSTSDLTQASKRSAEEGLTGNGNDGGDAKRARIQEQSLSAPSTLEPALGSTTIITTPSSVPVPLPAIPVASATSSSAELLASDLALASSASSNGPSTSAAVAPAPAQMTYNDHLSAPHRLLPEPFSKKGLKPQIVTLPTSLEVATGRKTDLTARKGFVGEEECGIRGFAGVGNRGIRGVIKQRFTDFLVNEISLDGTVLHLKDISKPKEPKAEQEDKKAVPPTDPAGPEAEVKAETSASAPTEAIAAEAAPTDGVNAEASLPENLRLAPHRQWSAESVLKLRTHLSDESIIALHALLLEGRDPPPKSDGGWGSRKQTTGAEIAPNEEEEAANEEAATTNGEGGGAARGGRGQGRDRGRGRGGRGGRGGNRGSQFQGGWKAEDDREVLSQPLASKEARTAIHRVLRECFGTTFESSTKDVPGEDGQRVAIKWAKLGQTGRGGTVGQSSGAVRVRLPQYIHFTLHKSNRETMDALGHLARMIGAGPKDLSVCGTKDKRAVTVQRVCLRRNGRNLGSVWRAANGVNKGRRTERTAVDERGERGVRVGDFEYSDAYLELGMLRGNQFVITLRNVQETDRAEIDKTMTSVRDRGFINFYGMQRFGTSSMPTHVTGLKILQNKWGEAVDSILALREGEHPDCTTARLAWLEDGDYAKAWELMPRRGVAERCIWDFWRKNKRIEDKMGALVTIPRNLRAMYVHAYQSYIWNLVVSERIKLSATEPMVGDLVFVDSTALADGDVADPDLIPAHAKDKKGRPLRKWATTSSPEVKALTAEDIPNHTIFDVVVPLPGWDVDYPGGEIGELYQKLLKADGLDAHRMRRDQREFSLPGSYRRMILRPLSLKWTHINYTDPDLSLVQSDEDRILNLNPPVTDDPEGKFQALKIELELGSATYATMCLREITREETSTWHQIGLSMRGEDREFKGRSGDGEEEAEAGAGPGEGGEGADADAEGEDVPVEE